MSGPDVQVPPMDEHDRTLLAAVHPPDWTNPVPSGRYNLVVIGAGTAGLVSASIAAGLGAKVALVERHLMGGDCLNTGCVPSKALLAAARAVAHVRGAGAFGVRCGPPAVDFLAVMERLRRLRAQIAPHDGAARFRDLGVDVYFGEGRFTGRDTLAVGDGVLRFKRAVIATGARAAALPIPGLAEAGAHTNETIFSLTKLPARLAVIGAGPIGCELAQAFARFGSQVTLVEAGPQVLAREDADAAAVVQAALVRDGVQLLCGTTTERVEMRAGGDGAERVLRLVVGGDPRELVVDELLVAVGRQPNVEGLGLEAAGVGFDPRTGVTVDERLRTSNPAIFAAGDVCSRFQFTHAADFMARAVVQNALFLGRKRASSLVIPWCTYTDPELAQVGLTADGARRAGLAIDTFTQPLADVDRARLDGATEGFVRVHVAKGRDRIVGATIVARHAGEMLSEITLAMTSGQGLSAIGATIHPYPTQAEAIRRCADQYARTRLTPGIAGLLRRWLAWTR